MTNKRPFAILLAISFYFCAGAHAQGDPPPVIIETPQPVFIPQPQVIQVAPTPIQQPTPVQVPTNTFATLNPSVPLTIKSVPSGVTIIPIDQDNQVTTPKPKSPVPSSITILSTTVAQPVTNSKLLTLNPTDYKTVVTEAIQFLQSGKGNKDQNRQALQSLLSALDKSGLTNTQIADLLSNLQTSRPALFSDSSLMDLTLALKKIQTASAKDKQQQVQEKIGVLQNAITEKKQAAPILTPVQSVTNAISSVLTSVGLSTSSGATKATAPTPVMNTTVVTNITAQSLATLGFTPTNPTTPANKPTTLPANATSEAKAMLEKLTAAQDLIKTAIEFKTAQTNLNTLTTQMAQLKPNTPAGMAAMVSLGAQIGLAAAAVGVSGQKYQAAVTNAGKFGIKLDISDVKGNSPLAPTNATSGSSSIGSGSGSGGGTTTITANIANNDYTAMMNNLQNLMNSEKGDLQSVLQQMTNSMTMISNVIQQMNDSKTQIMQNMR